MNKQQKEQPLPCLTVRKKWIINCVIKQQALTIMHMCIKHACLPPLIHPPSLLFTPKQRISLTLESNLRGRQLICDTVQPDLTINCYLSTSESQPYGIAETLWPWLSQSFGSSTSCRSLWNEVSGVWQWFQESVRRVGHFRSGIDIHYLLA